MTLSDAEKITKYIKRLNELKSKLNNYESCDTISGTINIGQNGLGFTWEKSSLEMQWLINGVKSEIEKINKIISDIKIVESVAEEKTNTKELLKLISENPDLPVVPIVDNELVADDGYSRWLGSFGAVYVGEYALFKVMSYDDREEFKEDYFDYYSDELCEKFNYDPWDNTKNEELEKYLDEVADRFFKKAIIVNIDLPDY